MTGNEDDHEYHCPRCGGYEIIDYGDSFDCVACHLEFDKEDADEFNDEEVLSVQEKSALRIKLWSLWF